MKILFVQPSLNPPGGGNLVACWSVQALRDAHQLTVLTYEMPDVDACNRFYGTSLRTADCTVELGGAAWCRLYRRAPLRLRLLKDSYLFGLAVQRASQYDLVLTANNEADLGGHGVQYIHSPRLRLDPSHDELRWYHRSHTLRRLYYRGCLRLARHSAERMAANLTLTNSAGIAAHTKVLHGIAPTVLHPPAPGVFVDSPWAQRENGIVAIARLAPEKRLEDILAIVALARARGAALHLHIVGRGEATAYADALRQRTRAHAAWATLHEKLSRAELLALLARQRYGIHAMPDEHFGIAVAEMVRAGCIPFVPRTGGPREIVGEVPALLFGSIDEAVERIGAVFNSAALQASLRRHLAVRAEHFAPERFVSALRELVQDYGPAGAQRQSAATDAASGCAAS